MAYYYSAVVFHSAINLTQNMASKCRINDFVCNIQKRQNRYKGLQKIGGGGGRKKNYTYPAFFHPKVGKCYIFLPFSHI